MSDSPLMRRAVPQSRWLHILLIFYILLGATYALITPVFEASDELWHYPMVQHLGNGNPLPVQVFDPAQAGLWHQEASQPPLYYYVGAALTFWIDTTDLTTVRWLNPHVDNGVITADGNTNLAVRDPAWSGWEGTLLAVRLVRLLSVLFGAVTVYCTFYIAKAVLPQKPAVAFGAAVINAFLPMFLFISGSVNNDNLVIALASYALLLMIRAVQGPRKAVTYRYWVWLGVIIGLGALTKITAVGLLFLAWGTLFVVQWQQQRDVSWGNLGRWVGRAFVQFGLFVLPPVLLIAGWWYYRNITLYGDWTGWNAFIAVLGERPHPASLAQLWDERWGFMLSFWGLFGGVNVPMWTWIYHVLNGVVIAGVVGFFLYIWQLVRQRRLVSPAIWTAVRQRDGRGGLLRPVAWLLAAVETHFGMVICLLWSIAIVVGLVQWATTTWSSQGRLVFTALSALSTLLAVGLAGWLPRRAANGVIALLGLFLFAVASAAPFVWIRPAYQPPIIPMPVTHDVVNRDFGEQIRLLRYAIEPTDVTPGEDVTLVMEWEVLAAMARDWSVFVHFHDPVLGVPTAQRDMYLGQGLLSTRLLAPGERVVSRHVVTVPETAVAPAELDVRVGFYDFTQPGERLLLPDGQSFAALSSVALIPKPGDVPNAVRVNFENEMALVGYVVTPRRTTAGSVVNLTLYWEALRDLDVEYTIFAQVVGAENHRWAAADVAPEGGSVQWEAGQIYEMVLPLSLDAATPIGVYPLYLGAYTRTAEGGFERLQIVVDGRLTQDDFLSLTQVRID